MDIRKEFLDFFKNKGHSVISSMPLVPDDPTLMFTNAGMVQFKDIFTGAIPTPKIPRATSCQLCVRAGGKHNDLENVGYTARHHTLFEMLGNFSFSDYFKEEAIAYAWEFITKNLELPIDKLWVTVHENDEEAFEIWSKYIKSERIKKFGDKDNFWSMGDTGPCGPCSEIFFDQGEENFSSKEDYLGGEGDRFLEIWNLVFMQFERSADGNMKKLPKPSIDTGMGLERVIAIKEGVLNNFDSSNFKPLIEKIEGLANKKANSASIGSFRVIADHLRANAFMLSQGILFGNEGRPYVNRRILRRAVRHGYLLGFKKPFLAELYDTLCEMMGKHYTELIEKKNYIKEQLTLEEERFFKTIELGMSLFTEELKRTKEVFSGKIAFKLYDTYGFPLDLTEDMLRDKDISVDIDTFNKLMDEQKAKAKASWKGSGDIANEGDFKQILEKYGKNNFIGYDKVACDTKIITLLNKDFKEVNSLEENEIGYIMLKETPFYATSGGQNGDIGAIEDNNSSIAIVKETSKFHGLNLSKIKTLSRIKKDQTIKALVVNRYEISKHHSATHLLQAALKMVLGDTVAQAGSYNDSEKLRFDFTYPKALTQAELNEVEDLVNSMISRMLLNQTEELPLKEAKEKGAIAMFGEKYGDLVRVVNFGNISVEFCGGTHVKNTSDIGSFYIVKESGVSSGVRRIEAVCGNAAIAYTKTNLAQLNAAKIEIKNNDLILGIKKLKDQIKNLKKELEIAQNQNTDSLKESNINDIKIIIDKVNNGDIKKIIDDKKNENEKLAILLIQENKGKVLIACGSKNTSIKAGSWIKEIAPIVGGGGGGRPDFAQAGGKDTSKINEALAAALKYVEVNL